MNNICLNNINVNLKPEESVLESNTQPKHELNLIKNHKVKKIKKLKKIREFIYDSEKTDSETYEREIYKNTKSVNLKENPKSVKIKKSNKKKEKIEKLIVVGETLSNESKLKLNLKQNISKKRILNTIDVQNKNVKDAKKISFIDKQEKKVLNNLFIDQKNLPTFEQKFQEITSVVNKNKRNANWFMGPNHHINLSQDEDFLNFRDSYDNHIKEKISSKKHCFMMNNFPCNYNSKENYYLNIFLPEERKKDIHLYCVGKNTKNISLNSDRIINEDLVPFNSNLKCVWKPTTDKDDFNIEEVLFQIEKKMLNMKTNWKEEIVLEMLMQYSYDSKILFNEIIGCPQVIKNDSEKYKYQNTELSGIERRKKLLHNKLLNN